MFTTKEAILERTGVEVDGQTLNIAHMMIEAYIGKTEAEIYDAGDRAILGRATMFQAVYVGSLPKTLLEQAAVETTKIGETSIAFNTDMFAPYLSPFAVQICKGLSWKGTRSVHVGPAVDRPAYTYSWVRD